MTAAADPAGEGARRGAEGCVAEGAVERGRDDGGARPGWGESDAGGRGKPGGGGGGVREG